MPLAEQHYDAKLRGDLGAADVRDLVVVSGAELWNRCSRRGARRLGLEPLMDAKVIGGFDSPANYLPSLATQEARRGSLPTRRAAARQSCSRRRRPAASQRAAGALSRRRRGNAPRGP